MTYIMAVAAAAGLLLSSCSKKTDNLLNDTPSVSTPSATTPSFPDGYGALAAVSTISYTVVAGITIPVQVNSAVGVFYTSAGSGSKADGGTVTVNGKTLTKQSNNAYVYQNLTDPLSLSSSNAWNDTGSASVPAFSYTDNRPMPTYSDYASLPSSVTRASGLTVNLSGTISGTDSVYVVLISTSSSVIIKRVAGTAAQAVFTPSELSSLSATSTGIVEVCPWNYVSETFSGKKFYFVNESAYTRSGVSIN